MPHTALHPTRRAVFLRVTLALAILSSPAWAQQAGSRPFSVDDALNIRSSRIESVTRDGHWVALTVRVRRDGLGVDAGRYDDATYVAPSPALFQLIDATTGKTAANLPRQGGRPQRHLLQGWEPARLLPPEGRRVVAQRVRRRDQPIARGRGEDHQIDSVQLAAGVGARRQGSARRATARGVGGRRARGISTSESGRYRCRGLQAAVPRLGQRAQHQ